MSEVAVPVPPVPPALSPDEGSRLARERFGVEAVGSELGSNQDRNVLLTGADGTRHVLKVSNPATTRAEVEAQEAVAARLAEREPGLRVPRALPSPAGPAVVDVEVAGVATTARLLPFLDGGTLSGSGYLAPSTLAGLGSLAGRVGLALDGLAEGPLAAVLDRPMQWDLRSAAAVLPDLLPHVSDAALRERVARAADEAWAEVERLSPDLRQHVVHGDLTDDNVVLPLGPPPGSRPAPDGVIDLGDVMVSWLAAEPAVTASSVLHHAGGSVDTALAVLRAFHAVRPLTPPEVEALWPLVVLRAAVLVASGHQVAAGDPGNAYAVDNLEHELLVLDRATAVPLPVARRLVAGALGTAGPRPPLPAGRPLVAGSGVVLDLSPESPLLDEGRWLEPGVREVLAREALAAPGAPDVVRTGYGRPDLTRQATPLVVELTAAEPVEVHAPWDGTLARTADGVVLHADGVELDLHGLDGAREGSVTAGDVVGRTAALRVLARRPAAEVPDAVPARHADAWGALSLDPSALLPGEDGPEAAVEPAADLLARRDRHLAAAQEHYYAEPPVVVRGWRDLLVTADAEVLLDGVNNVTSIGHAHPRLVRAVDRQQRLLNTNSRFHYPAVVELAERLTALTPEPLDSVFLVNSGSEAVDLALRIARTCSGRADVLAMREAYHGWTGLVDAVSTSIADNPRALETRPSWVHTVDAPNSYRGRHRGAEAHRYAADAVAEVERLAAAGTPVGTFVAETWYGNAGGLPLPDGYLAAVYDAVRAAGGLCVADEVQVGYGRLGHWFWGFEQQGVVPDVVCIAKAMGNGHPLGAVITRADLAEQYRSEGYFFSSPGGSPVSSVVGLTVLDVIRDERLQENARDVGAHLRARLEELATRHELIGAVHGSGLYLGLEFVRDRTTREPAAAETAAICDRLLTLGVVMQPTSDRQCVLKIKPPLCFSVASADRLADALDEVLATGW